MSRRLDGRVEVDHRPATSSPTRRRFRRPTQNRQKGDPHACTDDPPRRLRVSTHTVDVHVRPARRGETASAAGETRTDQTGTRYPGAENAVESDFAEVPAPVAPVVANTVRDRTDDARLLRPARRERYARDRGPYTFRSGSTARPALPPRASISRGNRPARSGLPPVRPRRRRVSNTLGRTPDAYTSDDAAVLEKTDRAARFLTDNIFKVNKTRFEKTSIGPTNRSRV